MQSKSIFGSIWIFANTFFLGQVLKSDDELVLCCLVSSFYLQGKSVVDSSNRIIASQYAVARSNAETS